MDVLYEKLVKRYVQKIPEIKWIDWDSGQLEAFDTNYPVHFPCILIDLEQIEWKSVGNDLQVGNVTVNLRIAFKLWTDTNNLTPDNVFAQSMNALKLINKIHKYTQGFEGEHFNGLDRILTVTEKRSDGLKVVNMKYLTNMRDAWAMKEYTETNAQPSIEIEFDV